MQKHTIDTWCAIYNLISANYEDKTFSKDGKDGKDDTAASWIFQHEQSLQW